MDTNANSVDIDEMHAAHYRHPIQMYWKFTTKKGKFSDKKNSDIFQISAQKIDCWYSLGPPQWGGSNKYPQSMILAK